MADSSRRSFLKKAALGGVGVSTLAAPAVLAKKRLRWKMVTTWPKNFPGLGTGANYLAKKIEELSNGEIQVRVYGAGELVPALGIFDAVSRGTAQLGHGASYYWKGKHAATQFFAAVPFGLTAQEMNGWLTYGGGHKLWQDLYKGFGLVPFAAGNTGVQMGGWFKKEIKSMADFKGLKMRIPGLGSEVLRRLGTTVVTLPGGEIFQALKSGAIDATEWVGPYNDLAFGFHQAAKNYYWPGWQEPGSTLECMVNKKAYEALPKHLQTAVAVASEATNVNMLSEFTARNAAALGTLIDKHRVKLKRFPDSVLTKIGETSRDVVAEIALKDSFSKKTFSSYDKFRKDAIRFGRISEEGYTVARGPIFGSTRNVAKGS